MSTGVRAGKAFIEMFINTDPMERQLRAARRRMERFGEVVKQVGVAFTALGAAAGTAAVAGIIKATNAAGDFAETVSKFETVFGDRAAPVREWAEETARALGITRREALATLSSFQDLFVPLGIEVGAAEEMSKQLTQLAVDLGSFNNMASADVVRDLQAAMTGSSETMKKYGAIVDAAAVKQELLNQGLDPTTATNAEKATARLALIMRSTTAAQGDAIRTADSYNNSLKRMQTGVEETWTAIGTKFLPIMQDLGRIGVLAIDDLVEAIEKIVPEFQRLEPEIIKLAEQGNWEKVGEIIGIKIRLGLREAIGPAISDTIGLLNRIGRDVTFGGLQDAQVREGARRFAGPVGEFIMEQRTVQRLTGAAQSPSRRLEQRLDQLLQETRRQTEAIEGAEGDVF